jgi:hypothetical protein
MIKTYEDGSQLEFRDAKESDFSLVADSFWRDAIDAVPGVGRLFLVQMLERTIANPKWHITIACHPSEPDEVFAWAIWKSPTEFLWISAKPRYQGARFASKLMEFIGTPKPNGSRVAIHCVAIPRTMYRRAIKHGYELKLRPFMALTD